MITVRLYQKKKKIRVDGNAPIYFCLVQGSRQKLIAAKRYVHPDHFDGETQLVTKNISNHNQVNSYLEHRCVELEKIIIDLYSERQRINTRPLWLIFLDQRFRVL